MQTAYTLALSVDEIASYIKDANVVAFDNEASAEGMFRDEKKAALDAHKSSLTGCSFSVQDGTGIYVPLRHIEGPNCDIQSFMNFYKDFLGNRKIVKVAHNIAYESQRAMKEGIVIQPKVYDTICAAQMVLDGDYTFRKLRDSGLKDLSKELLGKPRVTFEDLTEGKNFDERRSDDPVTINYGCEDSDDALRLYHIYNDWFSRNLPAHRKIVEELESPMAVYIGIMEYNGLPIDKAALDEKKAETGERRKKISDELRFIIGDVDIGKNAGTAAFKKYLFEFLGLPKLKMTDKGGVAADDAALILLKEWCDKNRPELSKLFSLVQEYRKEGKIESTYLDGYRKYISAATGRIHPRFLGLSTETGRLCAQSPNVQNMPRKTNDPIGIRSLIKAPEGKVIVSCDYSQVELRFGSFYCRDEKMLETYRNNGDIHAQTTAIVFNETIEEAKDKHREGYKEHRSIAKNINFGTFYGLYPRGLQSTLKFKAGIDASIEDCKKMLSNLKAGYPGLTRWQEETKAIAKRRGYTETWLGRRRYLPDINSDDWGKKSFSERCALNTPIQGSAADALKGACARILEGLPERPWLEPILQIHDELCFIVPETMIKEAIDFIKSCMEVKPFEEFDIPLVAEAAVGHSFGEMEDVDG